MWALAKPSNEVACLFLGHLVFTYVTCTSVNRRQHCRKISRQNSERFVHRHWRNNTLLSVKTPLFLFYYSFYKRWPVTIIFWCIVYRIDFQHKYTTTIDLPALPTYWYYTILWKIFFHQDSASGYRAHQTIELPHRETPIFIPKAVTRGGVFWVLKHPEIICFF